MDKGDYSLLEKRVLQSFSEITYEHRYVCKKRWRKLKQRGRTLCKDERGYYWLRPPKVRILNNTFDKFFVDMRDAAKYPERCVLCDSFPQYTVTGRFTIKPVVMAFCRENGVRRID